MHNFAVFHGINQTVKIIAALAYNKLIAKIAQIDANDGEIDEATLAELKAKFRAAMDNDLNTSLSITALYDVLKAKTNAATKLAAIADFDKVLCVGLIIKSNVQGSKKKTKEVEESAVAKIGDTLKQSPEEALITYTEHVCSSMEKVTMIYDRTIVAVFKENRKVLREMVSEAEEFYHSTRQQKYEIIPLLRTLEESDINTGHFYVQVVDYISETSKALLHITRPCYKHVDNNHSGLTKEQVYDLKCINDRVENIFGNINNMLRTRSFEQMDEVLNKRDELFNFIDEVMQNQLRRLRDTGGSSSANMLFFNILTETKTMVLHSRNIMKSLEHFVHTKE